MDTIIFYSQTLHTTLTRQDNKGAILRHCQTNISEMQFEGL